MEEVSQITENTMKLLNSEEVLLLEELLNIQLKNLLEKKLDTDIKVENDPFLLKITNIERKNE